MKDTIYYERGCKMFIPFLFNGLIFLSRCLVVPKVVDKKYLEALDANVEKTIM